MIVNINKSIQDDHKEDIQQSLLGDNHDNGSHIHNNDEFVFKSIESNVELYKASLKKLWTVSIVSIFFIAC